MDSVDVGHAAADAPAADALCFLHESAIVQLWVGPEQAEKPVPPVYHW
jgi:hypothetical protein